MTGLSIGEVARRSGLRTSAIRYYEKIGLLPRAPRTRYQRRYDPLILDRLAIVRFAQYVGLRLAEIKWLLNDIPGRPAARTLAQTGKGKTQTSGFTDGRRAGDQRAVADDD